MTPTSIGTALVVAYFVTALWIWWRHETRGLVPAWAGLLPFIGIASVWGAIVLSTFGS